MSEETITQSSGVEADNSYLSTRHLVRLAQCLGVALLILFVVTPNITPKTVGNLTRQFKGKAHYWNRYGEKAGVFERIVSRAFPTTSQIAAARMLGKMGPEAVDAVPALLEALKNEPNDIDTGDGVLPYRSEIAIALGKIGDTRAIAPLTEKLKVHEKATLGAGYSGGTSPYQPTGVGHAAIVEALGMFGDKAKSAAPFIRALKDTNMDNEWLQKEINESLERIENGK